MITKKMQPINSIDEIKKVFWKKKYFHYMKNVKLVDGVKLKTIDFKKIKPKHNEIAFYKWILKIGNIVIGRFWWGCGKI